MYSPKISEDLIPSLYQMSRDRGKPMIRIVDEMLREKLTAYNSSGATIHSDSNTQTTDKSMNVRQ